MAMLLLPAVSLALIVQSEAATVVVDVDTSNVTHVLNPCVRRSASAPTTCHANGAAGHIDQPWLRMDCASGRARTRSLKRCVPTDMYAHAGSSSAVIRIPATRSKAVDCSHRW